MAIGKILVASDFSECAHNAILYSTNLARNFNAKLILVTGFQAPLPSADFPFADPTVISYLEDETKEQYEMLKDEVPELNGLSCEFRTHVGVGKDTILQVAATEDPDLIIMGTHGESGPTKNKVLGKVSRSVIKESGTPVLVIPQKTKYRTINSIALACDYRPLEALSILNRLLDLKRAFNATLYIVHVSDAIGDIDLEEAYEARKIDQYFYGINHSFHEIKSENIISGLADFVYSRDIRILSMLPRRHNLLERFFKDSITRNLSLHREIPLLTIHPWSS